MSQNWKEMMKYFSRNPWHYYYKSLTALTLIFLCSSSHSTPRTGRIQLRIGRFSIRLSLTKSWINYSILFNVLLFYVYSLYRCMFLLYLFSSKSLTEENSLNQTRKTETNVRKSYYRTNGKERPKDYYS